MLFMKKVKTPFSMVMKLIISGTPMALTGVFYYNSLNYLDASIAIIMLFQFTWMGLIGEWVIDRIRPTREKIISVTVLFIGSLFRSEERRVGKECGTLRGSCDGRED